jgi:hypothetical protein
MAGRDIGIQRYWVYVPDGPSPGHWPVPTGTDPDQFAERIGGATLFTGKPNDKQFVKRYQREEKRHAARSGGLPAAA